MTERWVRLGFRAAIFTGGVAFTAFLLVDVGSRPSVVETSMPAASSLFETDEQFLDELTLRSWKFFDAERNPENGLIPDRAAADGGNPCEVASAASVGFGLAGLCIADSRGWLERDEALRRTITTLDTFRSKLSRERGFFYHYYMMDTGARGWDSEVSPIDTALFLAGAITAREYFQDPTVTQFTNEIYAAIDWVWMLDGGRTLRLGWKPETGFEPYRWDDYSEHLIMHLLGIGAPQNPLPPETWKAWNRGPVVTHAGLTYLNCPPLFTHQYTQAFFDFRDRHDGHANYFENSRLATLAQRQMCIDLASRFPHWGANVWGITASDSAFKYVAWGGPPASPEVDGTVVPCAAGGSIPFAPRECLDALKHMKAAYGETIWKKYGFADAFNPHTGWVAPDVIGIDVGISMIQAENHRTGLIWKAFMKAPEAQRALELAGFQQGGSLLANSSLVAPLPQAAPAAVETVAGENDPLAPAPAPVAAEGVINEARDTTRPASDASRL